MSYSMDFSFCKSWSEFFLGKIHGKISSIRAFFAPIRASIKRRGVFESIGHDRMKMGEEVGVADFRT